MSDFKMNREEVIMTKLNIEQFKFESIHGNAKETNQKIMKLMAHSFPVIGLNQGIYYRARIIKEADGEDTGIIRKQGVPITGYNISHSGVPPAKYITENGRANRIGEQVLYLAEDEETSCKENKAESNVYLSVAECKIESSLKVANFTLTALSGLEYAFPQDLIMQFRFEYGIEIRAMYIFVRDFLTNPNYKAEEIDYAFSLAFLDLIKSRKDISGVKYTSYFTGKTNIALWDENKFLECKNSKVVKSL